VGRRRYKIAASFSGRSSEAIFYVFSQILGFGLKSRLKKELFNPLAKLVATEKKPVRRTPAKQKQGAIQLNPRYKILPSETIQTTKYSAKITD
jgi:hypothetical protein